MNRVSVSYHFTEATLGQIVEARSKSNDQRHQQPLSDRKVRTSIKASMLAVSAVVLFIVTPVAVFGQTDQNALRNLQEAPATDDGDLVILSHGFEDERFSSSIIGEILNNDTRSYDKYDIDIYANFRDATGRLISSEQGFIDAETLYPQDSSAFDVFIFGDDMADRASIYDLIINDDRVVQGQALDEDFEADQEQQQEQIEDDEQDDDDDDNNDDDGDQNNN